jgi:hypothetical protein
MKRMDVVFRQMYDSTARLRYRELEFSRAVRLFYTPLVFGSVIVAHVCGKCVIGYGPGDCPDAGKRVGNEVVLTRYVTKIYRELGNVLQIVEVSWRMLVACVPSEW